VAAIRELELVVAATQALEPAAAPAVAAIREPALAAMTMMTRAKARTARTTKIMVVATMVGAKTYAETA
jgi:hypothetical protein